MNVFTPKAGAKQTGLWTHQLCDLALCICLTFCICLLDHTSSWNYLTHWSWCIWVIIFLAKSVSTGNTKGGGITVPLTSCLTKIGLVCFENKNKNCQLSYSWFQTSETGGQWYNDTSPFSTPWFYIQSWKLVNCFGTTDVGEEFYHFIYETVGC